jgi:hypothetical protein
MYGDRENSFSSAFTSSCWSISGLLIPFFTKKWQNNQKRLEIKIDLVGRISQTIMTIMTAIELIEAKIREDTEKLRKEGSFDGSEVPYDDRKTMKEKFVKQVEEQFGGIDGEYKGFKVCSAVLATQLESYFPNIYIGKELDGLVIDIKSLIDDVKRFYDLACEEMSHEDLKKEKLSENTDKADAKVKDKREQIMNRKLQIIGYVLDKKNKIILEQKRARFNKTF